jgi:endonuclease/exonuclease/phosphatase family metal-dependent hydrolase
MCRDKRPNSTTTAGLDTEGCGLLVVTWNVATAEPSMDLAQLFAKAANVRLVAVCLQEVTMSSRMLFGDSYRRSGDKLSRSRAVLSVLGNLTRSTTAATTQIAAEKEHPPSTLHCSPDVASDWEMISMATLRLYGDFEFVARSQLGGLRIVLFAQRELLAEISDIRCGAVACGKGGLGNKGAVAIGCQIGVVRLAVVNTHFAAGSAMKSGAAECRQRNYHRIVEHLGLKPVAGEGTKSRLSQYDAVVWAGDLNSRLIVSKSQISSVLRAIQSGPAGLKQLFRLDELECARRAGLMFANFQEAPVDFLPTYKFVIGGGSSSEYDVGQMSRKKRVPAWCDRVLFRGPLSCEKYEYLAAFDQSDHKPVVALLRLQLYETCHERFGVSSAVLASVPEMVDSTSIMHSDSGGSNMGFDSEHDASGNSSESEPMVLEWPSHSTLTMALESNLHRVECRTE